MYSLPVILYFTKLICLSMYEVPMTPATDFNGAIAEVMIVEHVWHYSIDFA